MGPRVSIVAGAGGHGSKGGTGGAGGNIQNILIHPVQAPPDETSPLMRLPRASYAAHDSFREDVPSSCLKNTRVAILNEILTWLGSASGERRPVCWLSGLAGIGKSTIAKTVAERASENGMLGATFFFSRHNKDLRNPGLVLPTLAFQLARSDSAYQAAILDALRRDETIGEKELPSQLEELILTPLLAINPSRSPILIILDAFDECEEEGAAHILRLIFERLMCIPFLRILITSRPLPHLTSVRNEALNPTKTVLHVLEDIPASVVRRDIRLYISTELARIPGKLGLKMPTNWATEADNNSLVEKSEELFVYAATAIRFIGDDRVRTPQTQLRLILNAQSLEQAKAEPYSYLDQLYTEVLRKAVSSRHRLEILKRFQIVIGSIVLLRELLPLHSLAKFVCYETHIVQASLDHFHSVIVPPSDIHEAPRIYHTSFREFITNPKRCSMAEFVIVPVPEQELRHAIRCFQLMAVYLKRDVAGISDPSLLNEEVDGLEGKVREALPPDVQYACRYWAVHLSQVQFRETRMMEALEAFMRESILWWFEAMSLLGSISEAASSIEEAHKWAKNSKSEANVLKILSDSHRFILAHWEVIRASALHVYHSALPFTPCATMLYETYGGDAKDSIWVLQGMESEWSQHPSTLHGHSGSVRAIAFSPDGSCLASGSDDHTVRLWDPVSGVSIATLKGHSDLVRTVAFSPDGSRLATGSEDHTLHLWDPRSCTSIAKLEGHSDWVVTTAFSPDGRLLASGSYDHTLRLWNAKSGAFIRMIKDSSDRIQELQFSFDGYILISHLEKETLTWDLDSQLSYQSSSVTTAGPSVATTPLIWYHQSHWIQVMQQQDGHPRRICYIPSHHLLSTKLVVSSQETYSRLAVGCYDGRMIILIVSHDLLGQDFSMEPVDTQLPGGATPHSPVRSLATNDGLPLTSDPPPFTNDGPSLTNDGPPLINEEPPLVNHDTSQKHARGFHRVLQRLRLYPR